MPRSSLSSSASANPAFPAPAETSAAGTVRVWVNRHPQPSGVRRFLKAMGVAVTLLSAGVGVSVCLWVSGLLILRPYPPRWITRTVPYFAQGWQEAPPQSLADIRAELKAAGQIAENLVTLGRQVPSISDEPLYLLPVQAIRRSCRQDCKEIVAIRLYRARDRQQPEQTLQLTDQLAVQGPSEVQVIDPIRQSNPGGIGSTHILPLTQLKSLSEKNLPGAWFTLTGRWQHQGSPVLYGQILQVDDQTLRIHSLLNWHSPPGSLPVWQNLEGAGLPELIVNQSIGLEPHIRAYTIARTTAVAAPTRLLEVGLDPVAPAPLRTQAHYVNGLFLAQRQLWSAAQDRLTQLKAQFPDQWSDALERQLQLTMLHARVSQRQTEREWARSSSTLLALLLDGQWTQALTQLEQGPAPEASAVLPFLEQNSARLWGRITASLQVDAGNPAARLWGALLLLAKEDEAVALQWLATAKDGSLKPRFEAIATRLQPAPPTSTATTAATDPKPTSANKNAAASQRPIGYSGLFGTAHPLVVFDPAVWRLPSDQADPAALQLPPKHQWYEITLQAGHRNGQWQQPLTLANNRPSAASDLWQALSQGSSLNLTLVSATAPSTQQRLQVQAYQQQGGQIKLLASGLPSTSPHPGIVTTSEHWGSPAPQTAIPWEQFSEENSPLADRLLTALGRHLAVDVALLKAQVPLLDDGTPRYQGDITVQFVHVSHQPDPDVLVSLSPTALTQLGVKRSETGATQRILINAQGKVLHSDVDSAPTRLVGWLTPTSGASAIVLRQHDTYTMSEMPHH